MAQYLDTRGLLSLILSAKRFYVSSVLWEILYREKARYDEEHHGWPVSLVFAAFCNQVEAFKALLALTMKDSSIKEAVIPVEKLPHATSECWKGLNYRHGYAVATRLYCI